MALSSYRPSRTLALGRPELVRAQCEWVRPGASLVPSVATFAGRRIQDRWCGKSRAASEPNQPWEGATRALETPPAAVKDALPSLAQSVKFPTVINKTASSARQDD